MGNTGASQLNNGQMQEGSGEIVFIHFDSHYGAVTEKRLTNMGTNSVAGAISLLEDGSGYILTATDKNSPENYKVLVAKINETGEEEWQVSLGNPIKSPLDKAIEKAGAIIPVMETIEGTTQTHLTGYVTTGTFNLGTNRMIGLAKLNENGDYNPN